MGFIKNILAHPLTRGLSVDDPQTTALRLSIIQSKSYLKKIYLEWYQLIQATLEKKEHVLELGSGAGFFSDFIPEVITSEIFEIPGIKLVADACMLPFPDNSLDAIVMTDVFHHIPDVEQFLTEATRCIKKGGKISMIEPWCSPWAKWVYINLHSEPFEDKSGWIIPDTGPLSGANGALPWIVFDRDKSTFDEKFPEWEVVNIEPIMPVSYLISGGVSMRSFMPGFLYAPIRWFEKLLNKNRWSMFALIELELKS